MHLSNPLSFGVLSWILISITRATPHTALNSSAGLPHLVGATGSSRLAEYPHDPYQMRVPGTTTSLIFSKYGPPIGETTFLTLIAYAQYQITLEIVAAHGDGPVTQPNFEWENRKLYVRISRPLAQADLTWLMLADTLEGLRGFFDGLGGWFETEITILDDTAGPVGRGCVRFW